MAPGRGHGCGLSTRPPWATGEAGGHARTAGTATTILPIVGVTPAGPTPRRAVPPRLHGPTQGSRSPTSRLVPSYARRGQWDHRHVAAPPDHTARGSVGFLTLGNLMGGHRCSRKRVCPMELSA